MSSPADEFSALLDRVASALRSELRISYRGLRRRFGLSDDDLRDIQDELIHARRLAMDEGGTVLVWCGDVEGVTHEAPHRRTIVPYTPRYTEQVLSSRSAVEGEKKLLTVLFCDVVDSMVLSERLGPEGWHETIALFFASLTQVVHDLEGTVNQYTGDGVMALFGAPVAHEDHALRACMAALRIRAASAAVDQRIRSEHGLDFKIRIGLNSGEVVVASIGDDLRMDYTAQGQAVGIASRLENRAQANGILMSESCYRQVEGLCEVRPQGPQPLKGVSTPLEVFELMAVAVDPTRFEAARKRGLARFIGRTNEMAFLEHARETAGTCGGLVVGIEAEAGTGKSRLCHEFLESCRARGMTVYTGHTRPQGTQIPYLPMLQIFRGYYGIAEDEDPASARAKIRERLLGIDPELADVVPLVQELLGVADRDAPTIAIDPDAKQRRLLDLLRRIIQGDSAGGGAVTCIEDLHWMDTASEQFLEQWVDALPDSNRLLVVSFRPGYRADWMRKPQYRQLTLEPLSAAEVGELLADLLGDDPSTAGLAESIFLRTGGNPFFCEEIVHSLHESGHLTPSPRRFRLNRPVGELHIPVSVQSVLAARIDRLGDDERNLLRVASVIGREFSSEILQRSVDLSPLRVARGLQNLKEAEFLYELPPGSRNDFSFKHALTQEQALNSQLRTTVRRTHARVARAIEMLFPGRLDEMAAVLAYHWESAGENLAAALAYGRAAIQVRSGNRTQQIEYIRKVLHLTQDLPLTEERQQLRLQGLVEIIAGGAWRFSMSDAELDRLCDEARGLAEAAGLHELSMMIRAGRSAASGMMAGDVRRWNATIGELAAQSDLVSEEVRGVILGQYSYALYTSGNLAQGLELALRCLRVCDGDVRFGLTMGYCLLGAMFNCVALHLSAAGRLQEGLDVHRKGIEVMTAAGIIEEGIWNYANQVEGILPRGLLPDHPDVQEAAANAFSAHERAEQVASDFTRGVAKRGRTIALLVQHRFHEAEVAALDCLRHLRERRAHLEVEARCLAFLSDAQLGTGQRDAALESAFEAVARSQEQGARFIECGAQLSLARALMAHDLPDALDEAATALERALSLADAIGARAMRPQVIEHQARLGWVRRETAVSKLREALSGYLEVGAEGHAQRLAAELGA